MNENQKAAIEVLIAGVKDTAESDCLFACLYKGLESMKKHTREQLARAVMAGEIGGVTSYRRQITAINEFDAALDKHPYVVKREAEFKAERAKERTGQMVDLLAAVLGKRE